MNIAKNSKTIVVRVEGESCDFCGKAFEVGEAIFTITDHATEESIYCCANRPACAAREKEQNYGDLRST